MKKTRILSLMLALCLILLLAGCGASTSGEVSEAAPEKTPEEQVTGTVAGLMDRLVDGQPKEAKKFCAEGIREADLFEEFFDPDDPESAYEYMGLTAESGIDPALLNEESEESVVNFIRTYNEQMFLDYEIGDLSVDGDTAEASVHVTYGIDPEKISAADPEDLVSEEEQDALLEQLSDEIEKTMAEEGEEAAMAIFYNAYLPRMMDAMCDYIPDLDPSEEDWNITLALVDDEWQITSIQSV